MMISVIIPAWNEERSLPGTLAALGASQAAREVLLVDGGSSDRTRELAVGLDGQVLASSIRQRAAQMNLGAARAGGEVFLFLHADTILPKGALDRIELALGNGTIGGGAFARRFDSESILLRLTCLLAELRNRAIGWHLGDQAIFARRTVFERLNGFRAMDRFEDLDFSRRMGKITRLATLRPPVTSSARRFAKEGVWRRTARDFILTMRYLRGEPASMHDASPGHCKEHVC